MPPPIGDLPACICPITHEVMEDPVVCADGHSYERAAITQWLLARSGLGAAASLPSAAMRRPAAPPGADAQLPPFLAELRDGGVTVPQSEEREASGCAHGVALESVSRKFKEASKPSGCK